MPKNSKLPLETFFEKLPSLPYPIAAFITIASPILLVIALIALVFSLSQFGLSLLKGGSTSLTSMLFLFDLVGIPGTIRLLVPFILTIWLIFLIPDLFARKLSAWRRLYWITFIYFFSQAISSLLGLVSGSAFSLLYPSLLSRLFITGLITQVLIWFANFYVLFKTKKVYELISGIQQDKNSKTNIRLTCLVVLLIFVGLGYIFQYTIFPVKKQSAVSAFVAPSDWQKAENKTCLVAISYPPGWSAKQENTTYMCQLTINNFDMNGGSSGKLKTGSFVAVAYLSNSTWEKILKYNPKLPHTRLVGEEAVEFQSDNKYDPEGLSGGFYLRKGNSIFSIVYNGPSSDKEADNVLKIVNSIKFTGTEDDYNKGFAEKGSK